MKSNLLEKIRYGIPCAYTTLVCAICFGNEAQAAYKSSRAPAARHYASYSFFSDVKVTGTVTDKLGKPLPGVTIRVTGTNHGTVTDVNGHFEILMDEKGQVEVSFIGYRKQVIPLNNSIVLTIVMEAEEGNMNEVVVVGYGQQKKISLVGAQSSVNLEDIKQPVANLSASLAGRIAGLVGVQRSGLPGSNSADVWIRGISTFGDNDNSPLIIVDGVQGRDLNAFDPEDIASFSILKDASATAVYGAQGANGVILITTKKGTVGKPNLMFNYTQGFNSFTKTPKLASAEQYMRLRNEAEEASGKTAEYSDAYIDSTLAGNQPYVYPNVDWMNALFKESALTRRFNFSSRGGNENTQFYSALSYYEEASLLRIDNLQAYNADTRFKRYNFTSNVDMKWTKTTKFSLGIQGYITNYNQPGNYNAEDAFAAVMKTNPVLYPKMYPDSKIPAVNSSWDAQPNPYAMVTQTGYRNTFASQLYSNAAINQDLGSLVKGLSAHTMFSFDTWNSHLISRTRTPTTYQLDKSDPYNDDGSLNLTVLANGTNALSYSRTNAGNRQLYTETGINYDNQFGFHNITAMLLYMQNSYTDAYADDLTSSLPYRKQGLSGRATYSFRDRYFGEFDFGYTGSENLSSNRRFGFFPSIGVGWVLSNEAFFKPVENAFQFFKLRYSYGLVGSGSGGRRFGYLTLVTDNATGYTYGKSSSTTSYSGVAISDYGVDLRWAVSHKQDLGLEFKTLNSLLSVTLDYFHEHRTQVYLQRASLPTYLGLQNEPYGNLGVINNQGFDGTIELAPFSIGKTSWTFRGTFSYNKDKIIENDQPEQPYPYMEQRGRNLNADYGYVAEGLFQSQADIDNHADQSALGSQRVGDIKYKDMNGDGVVNTNDVTKIGNGDVGNWVYGFGFNIKYKDFYFGAFFQGVAGADRQLSGDGIIPFNNSTGAERSNLFAISESRWTEDNHAEKPFYPRLAYGNTDNKNNSQASTWWEKDIDFIRLKTLDFGYYLPKEIIKAVKMKNARIYVQGVNLFYLSKFKLWDPELNTTNGTAYPNTRTISFGVQANF